MTDLAVVDYGAGNLCSVCNALSSLGAAFVVTDDAALVAGASSVILPGVGHFGQMTRAIDALGLRAPLVAHLAQDKPFLGICLGMQALFEGSEEAPQEPGLGVLAGRVERLQGSVRVPHIGWNTLRALRPSILLADLGHDSAFYFANGFAAPLSQCASAACDYGSPWSAVVERGKAFGVQFHPEKSGSVGLHLLGNFLGVR